MARRDRYDEYLKRKQGVLEPSAQWKAAAYLRISREDGDKEESDSIGSQKDITREYIDQSGDLSFAGEYIDDGWSGTNFTRPDFERMMADIKSGTVNCIVVKDLSRLGRNYILVGQYLEMIFPLFNIRFISVVDRIDSVKDPASINNALVSFKNVMNDEYCRDISNKIRASLDRKRGKGEFIGSFASYGYCKDPEDRHHLVIDPAAAEVVRSIYQWFLGGMSIRSIAKKLNQLGVPNPALYKKQLGFKYRHPAGERWDGLWPDSSVKRILKNRIYTGDMVQGKTTIKSYKVPVCVNIPEEKWTVVPDTHEAIIPTEQFETVQQLLRRDTRAAPGVTHVSIFGGYIRCADCRRTMGKKTITQPYQTYHYYVCQTFRRGGESACTKHTIREEKLYQAVLTAIQTQIQLAVSLDDVLQTLREKNVKAHRSSRLEAMLQRKEQERTSIAQCRLDLYPDWKGGILSKEEYLALKEKFDRQLEQADQAISNIRAEIGRYRAATDAENPFIRYFLKYRNLTELTREAIVALIEMIYVHEGGTITIDFKYQDEYQRLLDLLEEQDASTKAG